MTLTVITPPDGEALSLDAAKDYLRIGTDGEDALVTALIAAARARLEAASGLALVTRTLKQGWECWPGDVTRRGAWLGAGRTWRRAGPFRMPRTRAASPSRWIRAFALAGVLRWPYPRQYWHRVRSRHA